MKYYNEWRTFLKDVRGLSEATCETYHQATCAFDDFCVNELLDADAVQAKDVARFLAYSSQQGLAHTTINLRRAALLSYFTYCVQFHGYPDNPVLSVQRMREPLLLPEYMPLEDIEEAVRRLDKASFRGSRAIALLWMMAHCGLRCSEVCHLRWSDVRGNLLFVMGKGNKQRCVPMSQTCFDALADWVTNRDKYFRHGEGFVFCQEDGKPLTRSILYHIVHDIFAGTHVSHLGHPHALRHTFATICCMHGVPIPKLQHLMGHSSPMTTFRYLSVVDADKNPFDNF